MPCYPASSTKSPFAQTGWLAHWTIRLLLLAWALSLAGAVQAATVPLIELTPETTHIELANASRFWVEDGNLATLDDIELRASIERGGFEVRAHGDVRLLHRKTLWITFDAVSRSDAYRWLMELSLPGVDHTVLAWRAANGQWQRQVAGDSIAVDQWPLPDRFPVFALSPEVNRPVRYFVRIEHARVPFSAPLRIYSHPALVAQRETEHLLLGSYFGLAILVVVLALANATTLRDRGFLLYGLYVLALAVAQASYMGLAGQYLWPGWPWWTNAASFLLPALAASAGLYFVRHVLAPGRISKPLDALTLGWVVLSLLVALLDAAIQTRLSFQAVALGMSGNITLALLISWRAWRQGDSHARWIALGMAPVLLAAPLPILRNLGLIPVSFWTAYAVAIGAAVQTPLLLYAIGRRTATRREAQARAIGLSRSDPLTGLTNHHTFLIRLHDALVRSQRFKYQCALLVVDLSNHAEFLRDHGRETAERALVLAASRMRVAIRDVDTAARVGETQLALLIEGPATAQMAQDAATLVVARGLRPSEVLPLGATLKFNVATALLPDRQHDFGHDAQAYLEWLSQAATAMATEPRKSIRTFNFQG